MTARRAQRRPSVRQAAFQPGRRDSRTVIAYYDTIVPQEWRRLVRDAYHQLEWLTTERFLQRYLPPSGHVLDAGGGPGRYTLDLARRGYRVSLLDLAPANVEFARRRIRRAGLQDQIVDVGPGSVVDLGRYPADTFDAVLCLGGVLSHLRSERDRGRAASELLRVAKRDAPIFASVIGRMGLYVAGLVRSPHQLTKAQFRRIRATGDYAGRHGFTECHLFLPDELRELFARPEVRIEVMVGLEGLASGHARKLNAVARNPARWRAWLQTHFETCTHPAAVGVSEHLLLVGRKKS